MKSLSSLAGRALSKTLIKKFRSSGLTIETPDGTIHRHNSIPQPGIAPLEIKDWSFFLDLLLGYDLGFAESYLQQKWAHPNLDELFEHLANQTSGGQFNKLGSIAPSKLYSRLTQSIRSSNTVKQAGRNISELYDLSNEFFRGFLDPTMTYSCAIFDQNTNSLEQAQDFKTIKLLEAGPVREGDEVLDVGCGWGNLTITAARVYGANVCAITISKNQLEYTQKKVRLQGLNHLVDVQLMDYRSVHGRFDHIFSIEMLEAVGHKGLTTFFERCAPIIRTKGTLQVQVITIPDDRYDSYRKNCDFIQKYIFPGGLLVPLKLLEKSASEAGFEIYNRFAIGDHYVRTLQMWKENLSSNWESLIASGFTQRDLRRFFYYFSYCEGAFRSGRINDYQISMRKT